jgi:polyphenol oxidase
VLVPPGRGGVAFTARPGGVSVGPYAGLNLGTRTGDDPGHVAANRRAISRALGIPDQWASVTQVHGNRVVVADPENLMDLAALEADAIVTGSPNLPLAVMAADCLPIALTGSERSAVVHVGWRGLCRGVIEAAFDTLGETSPSAWIGPSVGPCHFEVGPEVVEHFELTFPDSPCFWEKEGGRFRFDLRAACRWRLRAGGAVVDDQDPICTYCDDRFYSYRRDGGTTGRQAVLVWK